MSVPQVPYPRDDAPVGALVAFCRWNDRNGNWPDHISVIDPARFGCTAIHGCPGQDADISAPINAAHCWYDHESDSWFTDGEILDQLRAVIAQWREDDAPAPCRSCGEVHS